VAVRDSLLPSHRDRVPKEAQLTTRSKLADRLAGPLGSRLLDLLRECFSEPGTKNAISQLSTSKG